MRKQFDVAESAETRLWMKSSDTSCERLRNIYVSVLDSCLSTGMVNTCTHTYTHTHTHSLSLSLTHTTTHTRQRTPTRTMRTSPICMWMHAHAQNYTYTHIYKAHSEMHHYQLHSAWLCWPHPSSNTHIPSQHNLAFTRLSPVQTCLSRVVLPLWRPPSLRWGVGCAETCSACVTDGDHGDEKCRRDLAQFQASDNVSPSVNGNIRADCPLLLWFWFEFFCG